MRSRPLDLNQALAFDKLEQFVRQEEEARGAELNRGSDFERALALLITQRRTRSDDVAWLGTRASGQVSFVSRLAEVSPSGVKRLKFD